MKQIEIPFENKSFHFSKNDFALAGVTITERNK
jgi:hypothetical protein